MPLLRTLIVEDEPAVGKELEWLVAREKSLKLEATAGSVQRALQIIRDLNPDLVLMDISDSDFRQT